MKRYWFRQKTFGYGATPNTWEGWALTFAGIALTIALVYLGPSIRDDTQRLLWIVLGLALIWVPFGLLAKRKTEGGWRWRSGPDDV